MPGINQLPSGAEGAAAVSLIWAIASWICSGLLLGLTWAHHEGWSCKSDPYPDRCLQIYNGAPRLTMPRPTDLALLSVSSLFSNVFSIIQQCRDMTWYVNIQTDAFERKMRMPADDPELAIAGGSFGVDLVLYYLRTDMTPPFSRLDID